MTKWFCDVCGKESGLLYELNFDGPIDDKMALEVCAECEEEIRLVITKKIIVIKRRKK